jgi:choline dehydrogenase
MEADIIVIGGGTAGCAIVNRLSEDGRTEVLLLEGGRSDKHPFTRVPVANIMAVQNPEFDWCYKTEPDPSRGGRIEHWAAGKVLGGGSAINGMMFIRGHRTDYDRWAAEGAAGWNYDSVLPYFRRAETNERGSDAWRGDAGPLSVSEVRIRHPLTEAWIKAATEAGIPRCADLNGETAEGVDYVQASQKNGWRHSSAVAHVWPAMKRRNLKVELQAVVTRILLRDGRAVGVEYRQGGELKTAQARRGVVVSSGTMASPKLLMQSGIGPAEHLRELGIAVALDLPGVGGNLQDHVGTHQVMRVRPQTLNSRSKLQGVGDLLNFFLRGRGPVTSPIGHAQAFVRSRSGLASPNIQIIMVPLAFELDEKGAIRLCKEPAISQMVAINHPGSRGRISLRSADADALPVIKHALVGDDDDLTQLAEGLLLARRIVDQAAMKPHMIEEARPGAALQTIETLREYARMAAMCMYHPIGTCRMGSDDQAVVDPQLRVRGVDGLWVADASVMPSLTSGNINATVAMIGERASDLIGAQLRKGADQ